MNSRMTYREFRAFCQYHSFEASMGAIRMGAKERAVFTLTDHTGMADHFPIGNDGCVSGRAVRMAAGY